MTLARKNAQLAQTINVSGNAVGDTLFIPSSGIVNISGILTANTGVLDQLIFNTGLDDPNLTAGQLQWNSTEGTLDLGLNDNYSMHLGEELLYRVRNITGQTLLAGQPVYASGLSPGANNRIEVNLYAADGSIREIRFMGLMTEDLTDNGNNGFATQFGYIRGVDTRGDAATYGTSDKLWASGEPAWLQGDILYVHPTVPGKLTKIEPKHSISVAIITNVAQNGKIFVRPTSYGHLDDNHDVNVSGVSNGQFLQYDSATDYWVPSSSGNFETLLVNGTGVSISGHYHNSSDITNFDTSVSGLLPTISNSGDNRILTSTGSTVGINAENNLTFDGSLLDVTGSGNFASGLAINNQAVNTIASFDGDKNVVSLNTSTYPNLTEFSYVKGVSSSIQTQLNGKANTSHTHTASNITDFNSSVSGLLPVTNIVGSQYITVTNTNRNFTISSNGLQPAGNYSVVGHSHILNDISDAGSLASQNNNNVNITGGAINNVSTENINILNDKLSLTKNKIKKYNYFLTINTSGNIGTYNLLSEDDSDILAQNDSEILTEYYGSKNFLIPSGSLWQYCLNLNVFNVTDDLTACFNMRGSIKHNSSGVYFVGSQIKEAYKDNSMNNVDIIMSSINNSLEITTTGSLDKQYSWGGVLNIVEYSL